MSTDLLFSPKVKERGNALAVSNRYQFYPGLTCWKGNLEAEAGVMHPVQDTSAALRRQFYVRGNVKDLQHLIQTQL